jgi:hypothetical protein
LLAIGTLLICVCSIGPSARAADETSTWFGGDGDWSDPTKWMNVPVLVAFPDNGNEDKTYDAVISSGMVNVDQPFSIQSLSLSGGSVTGPGTLTLTGPSSAWTLGKMSGPGTTAVAAGATLSVTRSMFSGVPPTLAGRTLQVAGAVSLVGGNVFVEDGASINVASGGSLGLSQDGYVGTEGGGHTPGTITIAPGAAATRSGDAASTTVNVPFNNNGAVSVTQGTLTLAGGGTSAGTVNVAAGTTLSINANYSLGAGAALRGAGTYSFTGNPTLTLTGGVVTDAAPLPLATFSVAGPGTLNIESGLTLTGATFASLGGSLVVTPTGSLTFSKPGDKSLGRTVDSAGNISWTDGRILLSDVGLNNTAGGLFNASAANAVQAAGGTNAAFNNAGAFSKTSSSITIFAVPFNNQPTGTLQVFGGSVKQLAGGQIAQTANVTVANVGTLLDLGGHAQTLASLTVTGGSVSVGTSGTNGSTGSALLRVNGPFSVTGGGKLDLANNRLFVDYDPAAASPISSVRAALVSG